MVSKIITKEKARQEDYLNPCDGKTINDDYGCHKENYCLGCMLEQNAHKQSLINLKEYLEEYTGRMGAELSILKRYKHVLSASKGRHLAQCIRIGVHLEVIKEDIEELNKMIEKYK